MTKIRQKNPHETTIPYGLVDIKQIPILQGIDISKLIKDHNITFYFVDDTILVSGDELVAAVKKENEILEMKCQEYRDTFLCFARRHPFKATWIMLFMWFKELNWHWRSRASKKARGK